MLISNLQEFLRLMLPPLTALGINAPSQKSLNGGLEALVVALEPFRGWDAGDLAAWLEVAQTYRDTGQVPDLAPPPKPSGGRSRGPAASKAPKKSTAEVVAALRQLQNRNGDVDTTHVKAEVDALDVLTVAQLKEVHLEFLGAVVGKTKSELLAALRKRINDHRSSRDRVEGILS